MYTNWGLRPGDVLRRKKGPFWHLGIATSNGVVFHNSPGKGEHFSSLEEFANGKQVHIVRPTESVRFEILNRAREIMRRPRQYNYLWRNCEHTVLEIATGRPSSPTAETIIGVAFLISLGALAFRR